MSKKMEIVKHYLVPIFIILAVFGFCTFFLLENIPHSADDLDVNYSSKKIIINNDLLLTDVVGKNISEDNLKVGTTGYVEFEVSSKLDEKVKYEVVLTKENASPEIPLEYVKVYLTDENDNPLLDSTSGKVLSYFDLKVADSNLNGKLLYSGYLKDKGSKKFKLRMWTADTYELTATTSIFSAKVDINVK